MTAIVNAKTIGQFNKAIDRIDVVAAHEEHRKAISDDKENNQGDKEPV